MARHPSRRKLPDTIRQAPLYRRHPGAVVALVVLVGLVVVGRLHRGEPVVAVTGSDFERYHDRVFTVVHVVDGDTMDIDARDGSRKTTRIRLWGVDTPEVTGSPTGEMYWGPVASAFAKTTLLNEQVRLELLPDNTRGKYKRLLAYMYLTSTGEMFNEILLTQGHAYADVRFDHPRLDRFVSLEADARFTQTGLWRAVTIDRMPGWRQRQEGK